MFKRKKTDKERKLLALDDPKSPISESFRNLRTNIQFTSVGKGLKTILVTSTEPGEGKSTVISNLAVAMAQTGQRVLLVDCDLRRPKQHHILKTGNHRGLTSLLMEDISLDEAIVPTPVENLSVITSGPIPPNPSEMLGSARFSEVLASINGRFDKVLLDSPPAGVVTDSVVLSGKVDGVLLVVNSQKAKADSAKQVKEQLVKAGANILGVVLNQLPRRNGKYKYYQYYYGEGDKN